MSQAAQHQPIRTVELFAGIGGFRVAADRLGLKTAFANDMSAEANTVYEDSFGDDVAQSGRLEDLLDSVPSHEILTGGFPCQPFSSAGKKQAAADPRASVIEAILAITAAHRPRALVLENVPFILSAQGRPVFVDLLERLATHGYATSWRVVNTADFGLPQYRPRVLIVSVDGPEPPDLKFEDEATSTIPTYTSIDRAKTLPAWGSYADSSLWCVSRSAIPRDWAGLSLDGWVEPTVDPSFDFTEDTRRRIESSQYVGRFIRGVEVLYNQSGGSRMGYTIYGTGGLAPTLTATTSRHYERFLIGGRYRRLTPEEYALLQGFDPWHCKAVAKAKRYILCGNAIAPPVAEWGMARALRAIGATASPTLEAAAA